jgi:hypothetical protein
VIAKEFGSDTLAEASLLSVGYTLWLPQVLGKKLLQN